MGTTGRNTEEELLASWHREHARPVVGWDFSHLRGRMDEDVPPWDFDAISRQALERASHVLDMGTGGGEQLLDLADALPIDTVATEGWPPNVPVARETLAGHGIPVKVYDPESTDPAGRRMPFEDGRFDLVLNRHESFIPTEVSRVLLPGGVFLTQQVTGDDARELSGLLGGQRSDPVDDEDDLLAQVRSAGLHVEEAAEWSGCYRFHDVAALVAYLRLVPWDAPEDFTIERYADRLLALHGDHRGRDITLTKGRSWFRAHRR